MKVFFSNTVHLRPGGISINLGIECSESAAQCPVWLPLFLACEAMPGSPKWAEPHATPPFIANSDPNYETFTHTGLTPLLT